MNMTITELAPQLQRGEISPVELTRQTLARIAKLQPVLNAFITVTEEHALAQACQAEAEIAAGNYRGPLHGIPYAAKDLFYTKGIKTTVGSKILADFVPDFDCAVVEKLTAAGAVMIGKAANPDQADSQGPQIVLEATGAGNAAEREGGEALERRTVKRRSIGRHKAMRLDPHPE